MTGEPLRRAVIDPYGQPITAETLPAPDTTRWVPRLKARVVCAIHGGLISREEACARYGISNAELFSWEQLLEAHGLGALRTTRIQAYRQKNFSDEEDAPNNDSG